MTATGTGKHVTAAAQQPGRALVERLGDWPLDLDALGAQELEVRDGSQRRARRGPGSKYGRFTDQTGRAGQDFDICLEPFVAADDDGAHSVGTSVRRPEAIP